MGRTRFSSVNRHSREPRCGNARGGGLKRSRWFPACSRAPTPAYNRTKKTGTDSLARKRRKGILVFSNSWWHLAIWFKEPAGLPFEVDERTLSERPVLLEKAGSKPE